MSTPAVIEGTAVAGEVGDAYLNLSGNTRPLPDAESSARTSAMSSHTFRRPRSAATRMQQSTEENVESGAVNAQSTVSSSSSVNESSSAYGNAAPPSAEDVNVPQTLTPLMRMKLFELATSSSESDGDENQQDAAEGDGASNGDARRAASPPPNCAICLGRCKNKCFTDSCMHQFCFKCLCEWSKVKPECPLCKQTFKSIIHNVKSIDQFEEYHVQPPTVQIPHRPMEVTLRNLPYIFDAVVVEGSRRDWDLPRRNSAHRIRPARSGIFYPSPMGDAPANAEHGNVSNVTNLYSHYRNELLDMYHREAPDAVASSGTLSQLWRRFIYDRRLFALPVCDITGRFRESTARFYRDNPAQVHRLMPWINRDIVCLLQNTEHDVSLLLERINESLLQTNILSPAFRRRLQPYLGTKTSHFIHELNNFARSPYDMIGYDRAVHYLPQAPEEIVIEFSSSGSSDEGIASTDNERGSRSRNTRARNDGEFRVISRSDNASGSGPADSVGALLSFSVSTTSEGTEAPGVSVSINGRSGQSAAINLSTHNRVSGDIIDLDDLEAGYEAGGNESASTSTAAAATTANEEAATTSAAANRTAPTVTENIELSSGSSDECEFVLERKPPHLRTPELVSLNSESDSDVVFVDESKPLRKTAFASSGDEEQKQRHTESKNKRPTPQTSITTAVGETASHTAADREELYNVGASTSTGLRSSGGGRGIKEMYERTKRSTASRRKRNLRSNRSKEDTQAKTMHRGKRIYESSCTPSNTDSSTRSSDSDSDEDFSIKRQRAKSQRNSRKAKPKSSKRKATQQTRSSSNSRSRNNSSRNSRKRQSMITNKEKKEHSKRCKVEMNTDSEYSSDDGQNLIELQRRLQALKEQEDERIEATHDYLSERERAIEQYNSDGYNNASDQLPTGSSQFGKIQTQQGVAFTKQENFDSDTNENSVHSSYALDRLVEAAEECFGVARNVCVTSTNEDQTAALNIAMEEDNTFSSTVTQTTTATTVTTTAANNRSVSRASVTTNNTNDDNDNDNEDNDEHRNMHDNYNNSTESSSTSSSTSTSDPTASSHSLYSATSDSEEDEEEDEQQHQQQVEAISAHRANINENENENETDGNSLGLQQLLDGASLGDDWLVQQLGIDEESTANHENAAVNESSDTEDVSQQQVQVEEGVSVPDIDNDVSSIFLNQHDSNLVMPFNYDAEGSQSDAE